MKPDEIAKLQAYLRKTLKSPTIEVRKRHKKDDSAEVYIGNEFIGVISRDDEDGDVSYNFDMAILEMDLDAT
jgi:Protein of unknown function (DUF3126)